MNPAVLKMKALLDVADDPDISDEERPAVLKAVADMTSQEVQALMSGGGEPPAPEPPTEPQPEPVPPEPVRHAGDLPGVLRYGAGSGDAIASPENSGAGKSVIDTPHGLAGTLYFLQGVAGLSREEALAAVEEARRELAGKGEPEGPPSTVPPGTVEAPGADDYLRVRVDGAEEVDDGRGGSGFAIRGEFPEGFPLRVEMERDQET